MEILAEVTKQAWHVVAGTKWIWPPLAQTALAVICVFLSRPQRRKIAAVAAVAFCILSFWQIAERYDVRAEAAIRHRAYSRLAGDTNSFVQLISEMLYFSSPDWLPESPTELLSQRTADIICSSLDLEAQATVGASLLPRDFPPAHPRPTSLAPLPSRWWQHIARRAATYEAGLHDIASQYSGHLDADILRRIRQIEHSPPLQLWKMFPAVYAELHGPPWPTPCGHEMKRHTVEVFKALLLLRVDLETELVAAGAASDPNGWRGFPQNLPGPLDRFRPPQGRDRMRQR